MKKSFKAILLLSICIFLDCSLLVNKMAFFPTRNATINAEELPSQTSEIQIKTGRKKLYCLYISNAESKKVALYFHGNAENIYQSYPVLYRISKCGLNVFGADYRGYGKSSGHPSERAIYKDGILVINYLKDSLNYREENIIIIGRSIGSTAACNTAMLNQKIAGLILITPFSNATDFIRSHGMGFLSIFAYKVFENDRKIKNINCPLLIIAGTEDKTTPFFMAQKLYNAKRNDRCMLQISGAGHNDIFYSGKDSIWNAIERFAADEKGFK